MKAYLITSGAVFALLTVAHIWRVFGEQRSLATQPDFVLITLFAAALSIWAFSLLRRYPRS